MRTCGSQDVSRETIPSFNYTSESNVVNRGTLDTTPATVYEYGKQQISVTGYSPWNLPRRITTHANLTNRMTVVVTDTRWLMPLDFGAETNEIDVARCETDLKLSVPTTGTVVVSNATTAVDARVVPGRYPVLTGNSGGADLANWTLELAGKRWGNSTVALEASDKGLWIVVKDLGVTLLIIR